MMQDGPVQYDIEHKHVTVFPGRTPGCPVVYLNTFAGELPAICEALQKRAGTDLPAGTDPGDVLDFTLAAITGLDWNHDLAPWDCPPVFKNGEPCTGGAQDYLKVLTEAIIPKVEESFSCPACWRGIAGYSLAGLFALWSLYETDLFLRAASMSGSLWFPGFKAYAFSHKPKGPLEKVYFSLGNKECKTRNPLLQTVQENTQAIEALYQSLGIQTVFRLNPGNHYKDGDKRTADGIRWMVEG